MRTSVDLNDGLFQEAKVTAVRRGMKLKTFFELAVRNEIARENKPEFRIEGPLVPRKLSRKETAKIDLTNAEIEDLLT